MLVRLILLWLSETLLRLITTAIGIGTVPQFRWLGGSIGNSICAYIISSQLSSQLQSILSPDQLSELYQSPHVLDNIPPATVELVGQTYAIGF